MPKIGKDTILVSVKPATFRRKGKLIHRKGYLYRREDVGVKGKGLKVIPPLKVGELTKHGFALYKPAKSRRQAIIESVKEDGYVSTKGRLWALVQLLKRTVPIYSKRAKSDFKWLVKNYGLQAGFPLGK